jgi:L-histidine N-alpha-methyltransferase
VTDRWQVTDRSSAVPVRDRFEADVRAGLAQHPPMLPPKWLYDEKGSLLFDQITQLEEYYPTRTEHALLTRIAPEIAELTGADTLIELGSGTSTKTRLLLDAFTAGGRELLFVPLDVSPEVLRAAAARIAADYPTVSVHAVVCDFDDDLRPLPGADGSRLVAFLGSTIGNYEPAERARFLARLADALAPGDALLLGADLVKDAGRLVAAYDDADGVTAAFNRNLLDVLNAAFDGDLRPEEFDHVARWNADEERIEMWLRARVPIQAHLRALDLDWSLAAGDALLTETSAKFRVPGVQAELTAAVLTPVRTWCDDADDFSLTLAVR